MSGYVGRPAVACQGDGTSGSGGGSTNVASSVGWNWWRTDCVWRGVPQRRRGDSQTTAIRRDRVHHGELDATHRPRFLLQLPARLVVFFCPHRLLPKLVGSSPLLICTVGRADRRSSSRAGSAQKPPPRPPGRS